MASKTLLTFCDCINSLTPKRVNWLPLRPTLACYQPQFPPTGSNQAGPVHRANYSAQMIEIWQDMPSCRSTKTRMRTLNQAFYYFLPFFAVNGRNESFSGNLANDDKEPRLVRTGESITILKSFSVLVLRVTNEDLPPEDNRAVIFGGIFHVSPHFDGHLGVFRDSGRQRNLGNSIWPAFLTHL